MQSNHDVKSKPLGSRLWNLWFYIYIQVSNYESSLCRDSWSSSYFSESSWSNLSFQCLRSSWGSLSPFMVPHLWLGWVVSVHGMNTKPPLTSAAGIVSSRHSHNHCSSHANRQNTKPPWPHPSVWIWLNLLNWLIAKQLSWWFCFYVNWTQIQQWIL